MSSIAPALLRPIRRQSYRAAVGSPVNSVPRPYDAPQAHAPGENPDRVLVFGNGPAVGWGVITQELALPGQLARALAARTGRGCDVDLLADTAWDMESSTEHLVGRDLAGYDAVVVVIGQSDAYRFLPERRWTAALVSLLDHLEASTSPATGITVMGISPLSAVPPFHSRPGGSSDRWAQRLNELSLAICEGRPRAHFVDAPAAVGPLPGQVLPSRDDHRYRSPQRFFEWAKTIAAHVAPYLDAQSAEDRPARVARNRPQSPERRRAALWELRLVDTPREKRFDDIVRRAQQMFGTLGAAFSVIDENRQWNKSIVGYDVTEGLLRNSFCNTTIQHAGPFVVGDARCDERFEEMDTPVRFYAGYPVEAGDGTRIGALCVFDEQPRDPATVDLSLLRDFALAIQKELSAVTA
ncbi:GAF domain-containing protein [Frondihabitans australicus]|uniref:GAF domain-containing protein n=1 Tax=Frondihabitans australicus TaxID=386892 RepID=A0A495IMD4_9MICO|nr:GAF domain-containing protein [Frondihabitans australicus]RKR76588.1 GAF domain-containing protein [Frondihabitans australicus]